MRIEYPLGPLSMPEARARLVALGDHLHSRFGLAVTWSHDNQAFVKGRCLLVYVEGSMNLGEKQVQFEGRDPGLLLRQGAKRFLLQKLREYLDPALCIEHLPR